VLCWQSEDTSCCALRARDAREAQLVAVVVVTGIVEGVVVVVFSGDTLTDDKLVTDRKAGVD
jgi:hypothetical protein